LNGGIVNFARNRFAFYATTKHRTDLGHLLPATPICLPTERFRPRRVFDDDYSRRASAAAHADMRIADMPDYEKEIPPNLSPEERKRWNYQRFIKDYLRCVIAIDESVGALFDCLNRLGVLDETVVIYTSDNGFFLGEHGWYDKRFMDEPSIRVPLLVRYPKEVRVGKVDEHIVLNVDFCAHDFGFRWCADPKGYARAEFPTAAAGQIPKGLADSVLLPLLRVSATSPSFAPLRRPHRAIQTHPLPDDGRMGTF